MSVTDLVRLPKRERAPLPSVLRRIGFACSLVVFVAVVVRLGRDGYVDITGDPIGILDALYYASVTVTTTGYGDITAVSDGARLATILLILPVRVLFLILVVSTTVEVLTEQSRELLEGDATRNETLEQAEIAKASSIVVAPNRDDTAVLITLTAREMNTTASIVAAGKEKENLHLLRQGGATEVIDATAAVGRMLGMGTHAPAAGMVLEDLLGAGVGLELVEIDPADAHDIPEMPEGTTLVAIIRDGERVPQDEVDQGNIAPNDRIVVLRES